MTENLLFKRISQLVIRTDKPRELYDAFTQVLGFKDIWPYTDMLTHATAGLFAGNLNIEIIGFKDATENSASFAAEGTSFFSLVFEPNGLDEVYEELKKRDLSPSDPAPQMGKVNDEHAKLWTNVLLYSLSRKSYIVYLCEPGKEQKDFENSLYKKYPLPLGPLNVRGVSEVVLTSADAEKRAFVWQKFMDPKLPAAPGFWQMDNSADLRILKAGSENISTVVLAVDNLQQAAEYLKSKNAFGNEADGAVFINPSLVNGLHIKLVENKELSL